MSDAVADANKMKEIKEAVKNHEGEMATLTLEYGRKRERQKVGKITEVYQSLFIVEFDSANNTYVESFTYSDILTQKILIAYEDEKE